MVFNGRPWSPLSPYEAILFVTWVADSNGIPPSQAADRIIDLWNEDRSLLAKWIASFRESLSLK
jgi:hypothetical protein